MLVLGRLDLCTSVAVIVGECLFFLMYRRPPRSTQSRSSAASDVYKRQALQRGDLGVPGGGPGRRGDDAGEAPARLSLIHISEPTRPY